MSFSELNLTQLSSEQEIIDYISSVWISLISNISEWPIHKQILLRLPDKLNSHYFSISSNYYKSLSSLILSLNLSEDSFFHVALDFLNSMILLRKTESVIYALKLAKKSTQLENLISLLTPASVFVCSLFKSETIDGFTRLMPKLTAEASDFLAFVLPFKLNTIKDVEKLSDLFKIYKLEDKALDVIIKAWADSGFLVHSAENNRNITILIHKLMTAHLPESLAKHLFPGIQIRLASNNSAISNSGLLIASRVSELLNSSEIIKYTLEDFLANRLAEEAEPLQEGSEISAEKEKIRTFFLQDLLQGLVSKDLRRFTSAFSSAPELINAELSDLDLILDSLAEVLMKIENTFNMSNFEEIRFKSLTNLTVLRPARMLKILGGRINDSCAISAKLLVFDVMQEASSRLSSFKDEKKVVDEKKKPSKYDAIRERLKSKTKRFSFKPRVQTSTTNFFLQYFELFTSEILRSINFSMHYMVFSKLAYTLAELIRNTGGSCNYSITQQCVYMIKYVVKPFIDHEKREVIENVLILFLAIAEKLSQQDIEQDFASVFLDLQELELKIDKVPEALQDLAAKILLMMVKFHF